MLIVNHIAHCAANLSSVKVRKTERSFEGLDSVWIRFGFGLDPWRSYFGRRDRNQWRRRDGERSCAKPANGMVQAETNIQSMANKRDKPKAQTSGFISFKLLMFYHV